jgi:hypothetical protein
VTRDFVRTCQTPVLILPDDIPAHPYAVAMGSGDARAERRGEHVPWKEPKERIPLAITPDPFVPQGASTRVGVDVVHNRGATKARRKPLMGFFVSSCLRDL